MKRIKLSWLFMLLFGSHWAIAKTDIPLNELLGQFDEKTHPEFVALDKTELPVNKPGMYLRKVVADKLIAAYQDFKHDHPDIPFIVVSATRNYDYQNGIWQRKWKSIYPSTHDSRKTAKTILKYSSMPGTSRHHWGTDVDITQVESRYFHRDPKGKILFAWLNNNMPKYGFCRSYTEGRAGGYNNEEWHWSYKQLSKPYLARYRWYMKHQPDHVLSKLTFAGYDKLNVQAIITEYVFTINPECV